MDDRSDFEIELGDGKLSRRAFAALGTAVGLAAAAPALAADTVGEDVEIKTPDGTCDAFLARPAGKGAFPAVVMFCDAFGLRPTFKEMGKRLASSGYVVLVPNPYYRSSKAPGVRPGFDFANADDRAAFTKLHSTLTTPAVMSDATTYLAWLDKKPFVNTKIKAGVVGYCMGGPMTMQAAAALPGRVGAGVSCHGGGVATDQPDSPHLLVPKMKASFYFGIADNDDMRDPASKDRLRQAYDAAHLPATIEVYKGCNHGWCVKDGAAYNEAGAERAWADMLSLYQMTLV